MSNQIPYPRVHQGVVIYGPVDFPGGRIPSDLAAQYGVAEAASQRSADGGLLELLNTGGIDDLRAIKGVGKKTAGDIIASREADGPFKSLEDAANRVGGVSLGQLVRAGATV